MGANSGLYAVLAGLSAPAVRIFAFEPFPPVLPALKTNLATNALASRVTVVNAALGKKSGTASLYIPEKAPGDPLETSASLVESFRPKHAGVISVAVDTLDEFVSREKIEKVSLIRADVEGAEHSVLEGGMSTLARDRPFVFVEILAEITATYIERVRVQLNYRVASLSPEGITIRDTVVCVPKHFNHLLFPPEGQSVVESIAAKLGLPCNILDAEKL